ncbi:hypothetical protein JOM56_004508 [Amanita muscaria]
MSSSTCSFLEMYEPLDVIGNGSFGIIRKVRRKSEGTVFARKELNFERMSERDRKQIVAEVNILKDLHHEHIVRYIDRHVDRDAGILYILMEYCGGGDLSTVIKQAAKHNRPIPEDTIWNYFMQILLALHHCHHPNGHARSSSGGGVVGAVDANSIETAFGGGRDRRVQILHRDLKPDNVFLDENNNVKLGDFGLSKALAQTSFANTYVGTPYYMSPELMQEKAYDSKSDIWSLGCLIYELCALKPPFHEAKTHAELSICIRNGRIPPLPRGYSQALSNVIKSMLSLNPAMRPSAAQLLQHERLELVFKVSETEKMLATVKSHKASVANKERELQTREAVLFEKEKHIASIIAKKDNEIDSLQRHVAQIQQQAEIRRYSQQDVEMAIRSAVARREEELRVAVMQREEEVKAAMTKREEEILEAVRKREDEVSNAWSRREAEIARDVQLRVQQTEQRADAMRRREEELKAEEVRLNNVKEQLEDRLAKWDESSASRKEKTPLEEVKNLLTPLARDRKISKERVSFDSMPTPKAATVTTLQVPPHLPPIETPESRAMFGDFIPSAMKGVILTSTGQVVETPTPSELVNIFKTSPKVGLGFAKIFDFEGKKQNGLEISSSEGEDDDTPPPPSPSCRKERERERLRRGKSDVSCSSRCSSSSGTSNQSNQGDPSTVKKAPPQSAQPATRLRKPSIRTSARTALTRTATAPVGVFHGCGVANNNDTVKKASSKKSVPRVSSSSQTQKEKEDEKENNTVTFPPARSTPRYNLEDEDNLPSPFLKRGERDENQYRVAAGAAQYDEDNLPSPFLKKVAVVANTGGTAAASSSASSPSSSSSSSSSGSLSSAAGGSAAGSRAAAPAATGTGSGTTTAPGTGSGTRKAQAGAITTTTTEMTVTKKRPSSGHMLRAMAAANNAVVGRRGTTPTPTGPAPGSGPTSPTRSSASRAAQIHADSHPTKNGLVGRRTSGGGKVLIRS